MIALETSPQHPVPLARPGDGCGRAAPRCRTATIPCGRRCDLERRLRPAQQLEPVGGVARGRGASAAYASNSSRRASSLSSSSMQWSRSAHTASSAAIHCSISSSGIGGGGGHLVEEVPVGGERLGDGPQLLELHAGREAEDDDRLMCGFIDEPVDEPFPARVERNTRTRSRRGPRRAAAARPRSGTR